METSYSLSVSPRPFGDLSGDGTPDVIVQKQLSSSGSNTIRQAATLPIQLLSGRTGGLLWRAGPLPLGFDAQGFSQIMSIDARIVEPSGTPDLFVRHGNPFEKPSPTPTPAGGLRAPGPGRPNLARVSGRDGRILWNVTLAEGVTNELSSYVPPPQFADLNGDGGLDALVTLPPIAAAGQPEFKLLAMSLRDGKPLWSKTPRFQVNLFAAIHVGDLDGDKQPDVILVEELVKENNLQLEFRALDGRDGNVRWTWNDGRAQFQNNRPQPMTVFADLEGDGRRQVCLNFKESGGMRRIVVLDRSGRECARRDVTGDHASLLLAADLNGDGRDELLVWYANRLRACDKDLKEIWSWPNTFAAIDQVFPGSPGHPGQVIIPWALALDGTTGQPRATGQAPLVFWPEQFSPKLLDPGDSTRLALSIGNGMGAAVCRLAMPTTPQGTIAPPRGTSAQPGRIPDDPRWTRPLPWLAWLKGPFGPWGLLAAAGLALVNVALPLSILQLLAGRRRFSIRALMALPVAAVLPLMAYLMLERFLPVGSSPLLGTEKRLFILGTLAGLPIVFYVALIAWSLARLRWKPALALAALAVLSSLTIAAVWLRFDMKSMAAIEHYGSAGWYLAALPGVSAAAILSLFASIVCKIYGLVRRPHQARNPAVAHCIISMFHTRRPVRALGLTAGRRRQAISIAAAAVAATVLLLAGSLLAWNFYLEWRLGRIELTTVDALRGRPGARRVVRHTHRRAGRPGHPRGRRASRGRLSAASHRQGTAEPNVSLRRQPGRNPDA